MDKYIIQLAMRAEELEIREQVVRLLELEKEEFICLRALPENNKLLEIIKSGAVHVPTRREPFKYERLGEDDEDTG
jgi:hypothetical protein